MTCMALGAAALFLMLVAGLDEGLAENTSAWSTSLQSSSEQEWTFELTTSFLQDVANLTTTSTVTEMVNVTVVSDENLDAGFSTRGDEVQTVTLESSASAYDESSHSVPWRWHYPTWSWWQLVQLTSSVLGVVGQMLVMVVIWQRRAMNRSADTLIGALAVADFLTSILILPLPVAVSVPSTLLGEIYCRFVFNGFFMWLAVGASIHTLALISVERLIAVMYPILFNRYSSREKASVAVAVVWLELMITTLNLILTCSVEGVSHTCVLSFPPSLGKFFGVKTFLVYFIIPATVMLLAQAVTAVILHRKSKQFNEGKALQNRSKSLLTARKRVIQMLFVVVLIFIVCWGPNNVAYFLFNFGFISRSFAFGSINRILTLIAFYNSCLNPIVYTVRHPEFRQAIRGLISGSKVQGGALFEYKTERKVPPTGQKVA